MHTVAGLLQRLEARCTQGEQAMAERRFDVEVTPYMEGRELDVHSRQRVLTICDERGRYFASLDRSDHPAEVHPGFAGAIGPG